MKVAVIGLGQFGSKLAVELASEAHDVLAVDTDERVIDSLKDAVAHAVIADATDRRVLDELGLNEFEVVCVTIGEDFAASLLITGHLQEMKVEHLYCRVINPVHERLLRLMGVEELIHAETLAARQLAKRMGIRGATRHFGLTEDYGIVELKVPEVLVGKALGEVDLRGRFAINLVTVRRSRLGDNPIVGVPTPEMIFEEQDELVVFGGEAAIKKFSDCRKL